MPRKSKTLSPSARVEAVLEHLGATHSDLAFIVGVTPTTVSRWTRGVATPSTDHLRLLDRVSAAYDRHADIATLKAGVVRAGGLVERLLILDSLSGGALPPGVPEAAVQHLADVLGDILQTWRQNGMPLGVAEDLIASILDACDALQIKDKHLVTIGDLDMVDMKSCRAAQATKVGT